uniref:Protein FAR1-RELATED SEQUENCE n=1 Tax=Arundo donax TaxID=35708 RepID=A0A0A9FFX5_ARUDO
MVVKEKNGIWKIVTLDLDHNHPLSPNSETRFFRYHKYMSLEEKALIRTLKKKYSNKVNGSNTIIH